MLERVLCVALYLSLITKLQPAALTLLFYCDHSAENAVARTSSDFDVARYALTRQATGYCKKLLSNGLDTSKQSTLVGTAATVYNESIPMWSGRKLKIPSDVLSAKTYET